MTKQKRIAAGKGTLRPLVRPLPSDSVLRHMRPPTKEFPFWYYTGPWPNTSVRRGDKPSPEVNCSPETTE